jgi:predicted aconitase
MLKLLTTSDLAKYNGAEGPAVQLAMSIIVRMAEVYQAESLLGRNRAGSHSHSQ